MNKNKFLLSLSMCILIFSSVNAQDVMETFLQKHIDNLHNADEIPGREDSYTDSAIASYKEKTLETNYNNSTSLFDQSIHWKADPDLYGRHDLNGKDWMNDILATLIKGDGTHKQNAKNMLYNVMLFSAHESRCFTSYRVNYILNKYPDVFTSEKENDLKQFYATNQNNAWGDDLWAYNTENKCQMYRSTPYGIGLKWPQSSFIVREGVEDDEENGAYMSNQIEEKHIKPYFRYLLKYGMGENLSPTYMSHHLSPWTVFYELARVHDRQTAMDLSGGILDYYYTLAGLHYRHKTYIGTVNRARPASINDNHGFTEHSQMFGGFPPDGNFKPTHHATIPSSDYNPRMQTRRIIAGDIRMPYSLMQTCGINGWFQRQVVISDKGHSGNSYHSDYARTVFRYSYVHRQFSMGTGNIKIRPGDKPDYNDGIAGSASWDNGFMVFSSPQRHVNENWGNKFFREHKAGYSGNVGADSWVGYSPYMEMAQFENTAIVYCVIPSDETHRLAQVHVSSPNQNEILQSDDTRQTWYGKYQTRNGYIYFAFIPLHYKLGNRQASGFIDTERLVDDGDNDDGHCGYVVEMAHSNEITYEMFKNRANKDSLNWDKSTATISYTNIKGHNISLQHSSENGRNDRLPTIQIDPFMDSSITIEWEKYPTLRSPYMRVIEEDNREKLVINDNQSGIKIDFDGSNVLYQECNDYIPENYSSNTNENYNLEVPGRIEAENWISTSGVQKDTTFDEGEGYKIVNIDSADWMDYSINVSLSGNYEVAFRVASETDSIKFDLFLGETKILSVEDSATGSAQNWKTITKKIESLTGEQIIRIQAKNSGWNINWFELSLEVGESADPIITQIIQGYQTKHCQAIEISAPGKQAVNLSDYMIVNLYNNEAGKTINDMISWAWASYDKRYRHIVPGYDYSATNENEFNNNPGIIQPDGEVDSMLQPGDAFVLARAWGYNTSQNQGVATNADIIWAREYNFDTDGKVLLNEGDGAYDNWRGIVPWVGWPPSTAVGIFKILNDSIKQGKKALGKDSADYQLIDIMGYVNNDEAWAPTGVAFEGETGHGLWRKPEIHEGNTSQGFAGSWGNNPAESEWVYQKVDNDNALLDGLGSHHFAIDDNEPPTPPTNLSSSNQIGTGFVLSWNPSEDNIEVVAYDIYKNGSLIKTVTNNTVNIDGLSLGNTYNFTIKAKDAAGNVSVESQTLTITTIDTEAPTVPVNLIQLKITDSSCTLFWYASNDNIGVTGYDVLKDGTLDTSITETSVTINGLANGTVYHFTVRAKDDAGNVSGESLPLTITTLDTEAPTAPVNLVSSNVTDSSCILSWNGSNDNIGVTGYDVLKDGTLDTSITDTSVTIHGLASDTVYHFTVRAKDDAGNVSGESLPLTITTLDTEAPTAPVNLVSSNVTDSSCTLSWNASNDNIGVTGYDVLKDGTLDTSITDTSVTIHGLAGDTVYHFTVRAKDDAGNLSEESAAITVETDESETSSSIMAYENEGSNQIQIYPNPAKDKLIVENIHEQNKIIIYNMEGVIMLKQLNSDKRRKAIINISTLNHGYYIIRILDVNGTVSTQSFIKH